MSSNMIHHSRTFDWPSLVSTVIAVAGVFLILVAFGDNPYVRVVMGIVVLLAILGQVLYQVSAWRSPVEFNFNEEILTVKWRGNRHTASMPIGDLVIKKSALFHNGYWVSGPDNSFYLFSGSNKLIEALRAIGEKKSENA